MKKAANKPDVVENIMLQQDQWIRFGAKQTPFANLLKRVFFLESTLLNFCFHLEQSLMILKKRNNIPRFQAKQTSLLCDTSGYQIQPCKIAFTDLSNLIWYPWEESLFVCSHDFSRKAISKFNISKNRVPFSIFTSNGQLRVLFSCIYTVQMMGLFWAWELQCVYRAPPHRMKSPLTSVEGPTSMCIPLHVGINRGPLRFFRTLTQKGIMYTTGFGVKPKSSIVQACFMLTTVCSHSVVPITLIFLCQNPELQCRVAFLSL